MAFKIGIDVGNYDTKTQNTKTPSGFKEYDVKPALASEYLEYKGKYYAPTPNRFEYVKDKTETGQALILSLFGIAKEIYHSVIAGIDGKPSHDAVQTGIKGINEISIGVGLPVGDFTRYKDNTVSYYMDALGKEPFEFIYNGFSYKMRLKCCMAFPQDIMPVAANKSCEIATKFKKYLILGIGGQTVDVIPIVEQATELGVKKIPITDECTSFRLGVRRMYIDIVRFIETNFGSSIGEDTVERVLLGEDTPLPDDMVEAIKSKAQEHTDKIIHSCVQGGINFIEYPVVFFGGGGLLLRPYLEKSKEIMRAEYITDVNGNAKYYAAKLPA